jgi:hypothetical protein
MNTGLEKRLDEKADAIEKEVGRIRYNMHALNLTVSVGLLLVDVLQLIAAELKASRHAAEDRHAASVDPS